MPLARIITNSADDSLELTMQLRSRGFRVETVAPGHVPDTPADVEVRLEECAPEDVLTSAVTTKESEDLWVFVAPGALDERARPMRVIPLVPSKAKGGAAKRILPAIEARASIEFLHALPRLEPEDDPIMAELELRATHVQAQPAQILVAGSNGSDVQAPTLAAEIATSPSLPVPTATPGRPAKSEREAGVSAKSPVHRAAVPITTIQPAAAWEIPKVPERVVVNMLPAVPVKSAIKVRARAYRISFQGGSRFWRLASAAVAVTVLAGLLAMVVAVQPLLPAKNVPTAVTDQPASFSPAAKTGAIAHRPAEKAQLPAASPSTKATAAARKDSPQVVGTVQPVPSTERSHRARSSAGDGLIAEDTVKFYDRKPVPSQPKESSGTDLKRYSDAN